MYFSVTGRLLHKDETVAVIEAAGVGYEIMIGHPAYQALPEIGMDATLYTTLIVREDAMMLVGFPSPEDKRFYENLISVSGVGPKTGLKILSELTPLQIRNAVIAEDTSVLSKTKGIGPKLASRIVLELKDKIRHLIVNEDTSGKDNLGRKRLEVLLAMRVLGYADQEVKPSIDQAFRDPDMSGKDVEEIIRHILTGLVRGGKRE
ncbi:MAG: Holliday junction DNA helicase RuvA [Spirochaetes bacterium GWF1_51_8]|nr:MAG: Holliday junction DNA helicase RuvA [Spirochaetes bacterium GWF1_51_8]